MGTENAGKSLVIYWSYTGNTEWVAKEVARYLGADIEKLNDTTDWSGLKGEIIRSAETATKSGADNLEPIGHDLAAHDNVIVMLPFWGPTITPTVRSFLSQYGDKIANLWLVVTYGYSKFDARKKEVAKMGPRPAWHVRRQVRRRKEGIQSRPGDYGDGLHAFLDQIR